MPKIVRGTKDAKGNLILKGGQGGINKVRCPSCGNQAQPAAHDATSYKCANCGAQFKMQRM